MKKPCLAITLINDAEPQHAASYHWCKLNDVHSDHHKYMNEHKGMHECYCGVWWLTTGDQLVEPTAEMILWRSGGETDVKAVSERMLG